MRIWPFRRRRGQMTVTATVIRADGTREELGVVAKGRVKLRPKAR